MAIKPFWAWTIPRFSCLGWPTAKEKSNPCLGSWQLLPVSLESVATEQEMAISGFAGRFSRGFLSSSQKRFPLFAVSWIMNVKLNLGDGRIVWRAPTSYCQRQKNQHLDSFCCAKTQEHITTHQLLHTSMADAALPSRSPKSVVNEVISSQPWDLTPIPAAWMPSPEQKRSRNLTLHMNTAQQPELGHNIISQ